MNKRILSWRFKSLFIFPFGLTLAILIIMFKRSGKTSFIPLILILNLLVFLGWSFFTQSFGGVSFFTQNFLVSWDSLQQGYYWTALTSVFSHNMFLHFMVNMLVLLSFGPIVESVLGSMRFLGFYLVAGIISSLTHAAVSNWLLHDSSIPALGASGAIAGVVLLFSFLFPREKIYIFGIIGLPAAWGAVVFVGLDLWGLSAQTHGGGLPIGHGAHLGGAFTGIIYYLYLSHARRSRARQQIF